MPRLFHQLQAQLARQREHHVLGLAVELADDARPELLQALDHATDQHIRRRRARGDADVPAARIYNIADIFTDPHYAARGMLQHAVSQEFGMATVPGVVPKLSRTPGAVQWAGRMAGSDTQSVLAEYLGLSGDEMAALAQAGIVAGPAPLPADKHKILTE